jgi:hypothetical protein
MADPPDDWRPFIGKKVSVRYALKGDPQHPFSEAIGMVASVDDRGTDTSITIFNKRGERIELRVADVLAAKVFPDV